MLISLADRHRHPGKTNAWQAEVLDLRKRDLAATIGATMRESAVKA